MVTLSTPPFSPFSHPPHTLLLVREKVGVRWVVGVVGERVKQECERESRRWEEGITVAVRVLGTERPKREKFNFLCVFHARFPFCIVWLKSQVLLHYVISCVFASCGEKCRSSSPSGWLLEY